MLVLTAYDGEKIHIGDDVVLVIDRCIDDGEATRFGIDAPKEVKVLRQELLPVYPDTTAKIQERG